MKIRSAVHCFFNYEILGKVCYDMIGGEHTVLELRTFVS